jgi:hypothetical protein
MWSHQYDQMANQISCRITPREAIQFTTNKGEAHLFGLEPEFGCCTANMGQGWPKLALSSFMRTERGIASALLVPAVVSTKIDGKAVTVELDTRYPFRNTLTYTVRTDAPVAFPLSIRIPGFAKAATVNGKVAPVGEFFVIDHTWEGEQTVTVELEFSTEMTEGYEGMFSVKRGPLLYALPIGEEWHRLEYEKNGVMRKFPYCDYEILPTTPFAFGFASDRFIYTESEPDAAFLFSPEGSPVALEAELAPVDWEEEHGHCKAVPNSPRAVGAAQKMRLIPYGCTSLRMSVLPKAEF